MTTAKPDWSSSATKSSPRPEAIFPPPLDQSDENIDQQDFASTSVNRDLFSHYCHSKTTSEICTLPTWEQICRFYYSGSLSSKDMEEIEKVKARTPISLKLARVIFFNIFRDPTYRKFLESSWEELVDLIYYTIAHNRRLQSIDGTPIAADSSSTNKVQRRFNQLPCTLATTEKRVQVARRLCSDNQPILVLGDDDMVGPHLVSSGFQDVTSIDIDPIICKELKEIEPSSKLTVQQHDLTAPSPHPQIIRPYNLVFVDPIYSLGGVKLFLDGMLPLIQPKEGCFVFLSLHIMSLLKKGLGELSPLLDSYGLEVVEFLPGFNVYPVPSKLSFAMKMFIKNCMPSEMMKSENYTLTYFVSDAILLRFKG